MSAEDISIYRAIEILNPEPIPVKIPISTVARSSAAAADTAELTSSSSWAQKAFSRQKKRTTRKKCPARKSVQQGKKSVQQGKAKSVPKASNTRTPVILILNLSVSTSTVVNQNHLIF